MDEETDKFLGTDRKDSKKIKSEKDTDGTVVSVSEYKRCVMNLLTYNLP
jgi:hypothetical protein